jgi:hypothetical protein
MPHPSDYPPRIAGLLTPPRLAPLDEGKPNPAALAAQAESTLEQLFAPRTIQDADMARACLAGLWLYHDYLDESHRVSQEIETPTGSYWHGILHRREGDFGNAKYWFRRVGRHPVFEPLHAAAVELASAGATDRAASFLRTQKSWDAFAFVDLCQASLAPDAACHALCRQVQQREWELLFAYCFEQAVGA